MPIVTIDLTGKALAGLQDRTEDFNAQTGQVLKVEEWITLHLKELAIAKQLGDESTVIKADVDQEVGRRIATRRRELLEGLDAV
jgi:hypothetical protein